MKYLSCPEELIMFSIRHLKENAYLVTIREHVSRIAKKDWSVGAIYVPLDRLTKIGFLETYTGEATPERGGRRKKMYGLTKIGFKSLAETQKMHDRLREGLAESALAAEFPNEK